MKYKKEQLLTHKFHLIRDFGKKIEGKFEYRLLLIESERVVFEIYPHLFRFLIIRIADRFCLFIFRKWTTSLEEETEIMWGNSIVSSVEEINLILENTINDKNF